jgi:hypothetical protein
MPRHQERTPNALARGTAKTDDIERARHAATAAEPEPARVRRQLDEVEATAESIREEVGALRSAVAGDDRVRPSRPVR